MSRDYKAPVWPRRYPQCTLFALGIVLVSTVLTGLHQRGELPNATEKWYLGRYVMARPATGAWSTTVRGARIS